MLQQNLKRYSRNALFSCMLFSGALFAQSEKAQITGAVKDSSGAIVPELEITLTNTGTGDRRSAISNGSGSYTIPLLEPGKYDITAKKSGFRTVTQSGLELHVNQTARVDFTMEPGAVSESIEVVGTTPLLQPNTSDLGHVVENRQIVNLPLNGRNTIALAALSAGVRPQGTFGSNPATVNYTGWGNFSANGGLANANEVLIDGSPATTGALNGVVVMPPVDATEEFKVQTNNFSAEFDRTAGGVINMSLKSGTNALHGTVYEFFRNDKLDANNFFSNRAGNRKPLLRYNQFGASLGGPIKKDKTFFFGLYEGFRQRLGRVYTTTVPTELERKGDFSQTRTASGAPRTIYDPLSTVRTEDGYAREVIKDNMIPTTRIDPVAAKLAAYLWPLPNTQGAPFTNVGNFTTSSVQATNQENVTTKIDHHFTEKHTLSGSYSYTRPSLSGWDPFGNKTTPADDGAANTERTHFFTLNDSYVINPRSLLDIRASFLRFGDERTPMSFGTNLTDFGFPQSFNEAVLWHHVPNIHVAGLANFDASTGSTIMGIQNNYSVSGSLTLVRGAHNIKIGSIYRVQQNNRVQSNNASGDFSFDEGFTRENPLTASSTTGFGFASFLLGHPSSGSAQTVQRLALQNKYVSWYVQDDWRVTSKLTLNVGLRYSIEPFITERFNRLAVLDPTVIPTNAAAYTNLPLQGGLRFMDGKQRSPADTFFKEFAPRFGFAYSLFSKTVLRGGYGIFWLPNNLGITNGNGNNPAYAVGTPYLTSLDGGIKPVGQLSNPFPNGLLQTPGRAAGADTLIGQGLGVYMNGIRPGYMQQWNFDIQQDLGSGFMIDVAYAASKGTKLPHPLGLNQLPNQYLNLGVALNDPVANPFYGLVKTGSLSGPTIPFQQTLLPYPQFAGVSAPSLPLGNSTYHSMQMKLNKRFANSGVVTAAYTLSKSLTDTESSTGWLEPGGQNGGYYDNNNRRLDKSLANFDVTHRLVVAYNYELPFGKGKAFGTSVSGLMDKLVSGWQINGLTTLQSGFPVTVGRPNVVGDPNDISGSASDRLNRWFNTAAFVAAPAFSFGNAPRTLPNTRSDSLANFDFSLFKNTSVTERVNAQFRTEFFNVFNHPSFGRPDSCFGCSSFGTVNYQQNTPRQIQFALKLIF